MRYVSSILVCALLLAATTACGDAPCSGPACRVDVKTPGDATTTPSADWGTAATTKDCANGDGAVQADNTTLYYSQESASGPTPHKPAVLGSLKVNQPILLWRGMCNKSSDPAGPQVVSWSRAQCTNASTCAAAVPLGTFNVAAQDKCLCQPVFLEDRIGDAPGEVAGFYRYALSFGGVELASAFVRVE